MILHHLKLTFRNLPRNKTYAVVSIFGLAVAMACCIRVYTFALDEYRRANYYKHSDRIYQVIRIRESDDGQKSFYDRTPGEVKDTLLQLPEVERVVRGNISRHGQDQVQYRDRIFRQYLSHVEPEFLEMFDIELIRGVMALTPSTIVISKNTARKLFGDNDPIGEVIRIFKLHGAGFEDVTITGLISDMSPYSNFKIDCLTAAPTTWSVWSSLGGAENYVILHEGASVEQVETKLNASFAQNVPEGIVKHNSFRLRSIQREFLYKWSDFGGGSGNIDQLQEISWITLLIVLVACTNFVNLTVARSLARMPELATRKVVGAKRRNLIGQVFVETAVICGLAMVGAFALAPFPLFDAFLIAPVSQELDLHLDSLLGLLAIWMGMTLIAGVYPALLIARLQPTEALRRGATGGRKGVTLRRAMVALQGAVALFFVVSALVIHQQLSMMQMHDVGFPHEQFYISERIFHDPELNARKETIKAVLLDHPDVMAVTTTGAYPFSQGQNRLFYSEDAPDKTTRMAIMGIDADFLKTFELKLVAGRNLNSTIASEREAFLINETAAKRLGWAAQDSISFSQALGKEIWFDDRRGQVVGVVKDFHFRPLRNRIGPLAMAHWYPDHLALRIQSHNVQKTIAELQAKLQGFLGPRPVELFSLDSDIDWHYRQYVQVNSSFQVLAMIAVALAGIGLFAIVSFTIERRQREVGIRRVLGATVAGIIWLFMKENLKIILLSFLVVTPFVYYFTDQWLQGFAYRIDLNFGPFMVAGCGALIIALGVVAAQIARLSAINPVDTLRSE